MQWVFEHPIKNVFSELNNKQYKKVSNDHCIQIAKQLFMLNPLENFVLYRRYAEAYRHCSFDRGLGNRIYHVDVHELHRLFPQDPSVLQLDERAAGTKYCGKEGALF